MDKLFFGFGSALSGFNCIDFAVKHHLFSNLPNIIFMSVFIIAISVLGGAGMLLAKEYLYEKGWKQKT